MAGKQVLAVAVAVMVLVVAEVRGATRFGDCTHNVHCGPNSCCLVGFMRYSFPMCSSHGDVGSHCSPTHSEPSSRTLHYPNDIQVVMEEAHFGLCPCRSGLECTMGTCQMPEPDATDDTSEYNGHDSDYD